MAGMIQAELHAQLVEAARAGKLTAAMLIGFNIHTTDYYGCTLLHWVAEMPDASVVRMVLDAGAELEAKANGGWTPLHFAANAGYTDPVDVLLEFGADISAKEDTGKTAVDIASFGRHDEIVERLMLYAVHQEARLPWLLAAGAGSGAKTPEVSPLLACVLRDGSRVTIPPAAAGEALEGSHRVASKYAEMVALFL